MRGSRLYALKAGLAVAGIGLGLVGAVTDRQAVVWAAILVLAVAFGLRFYKREA